MTLSARTQIMNMVRQYMKNGQWIILLKPLQAKEILGIFEKAEQQKNERNRDRGKAKRAPVYQV